MKYRLKCNFCTETFVHTGVAFPTHCPLCFAYVGLDGKPEVTLPFLSKAVNKSPDALNRAMEDGANHRINMAAEVTGLPASDFASLKHTNMRDNVKEGDTTFIPAKPADGMTASFSNGGSPEHAQYAAAVGSGPFPNQGAKQIPKITELHRRNANSIVRAGTQAKY